MKICGVALSEEGGTECYDSYMCMEENYQIGVDHSVWSSLHSDTVIWRCALHISCITYQHSGSFLISHGKWVAAIGLAIVMWGGWQIIMAWHSFPRGAQHAWHQVSSRPTGNKVTTRIKICIYFFLQDFLSFPDVCMYVWMYVCMSQTCRVCACEFTAAWSDSRSKLPNYQKLIIQKYDNTTVVSFKVGMFTSLTVLFQIASQWS